MQKKIEKLQSIKQAFLEFQSLLHGLRKEQRLVLKKFIESLEREKMEELRKKIKV